jgi:hypothetical protein
MTTDYSSASNAKRAAAKANVPSVHILITKQADGRFTFADARDAVAAVKVARKPRPKAEPKPKGESKQDRLIALLKRPEGASVTELAAEFGWQLHTVRGAVAGALKRKLGIAVEAEKHRERGGVVYRIVD